MLKRQLFTATVGVALVFALAYGLLRLFALRLERGDVYPAYSTLRADPLGTRALYEALDDLPGFELKRNYRPLQQFRPSEPVTLVYAGVPRHSQWGREELRHFETLIANGSRAVFAFAPADLESSAKPKEQDKKDASVDSSDAKKEEPAEEKKEKDGKEEGKSEEDKKRDKPAGPLPVAFKEVAERWGFKFDVAKGKSAGSFHGEAVLDVADAELEPKLSWHSALRFQELQPAWRVLYRVAGEPAIIERCWGDGTIVLAADSFFLSNEALQRERNSRLLAWLVGNERTVVFDEEHLGVSENTGLVTLARKYRLQGGLAALALVALLWVWRQSVPFVPVISGTRSTNEYVAGLDSHAGFISLLRRSLPPTRVLTMCVDEWRKTFGHDHRTAHVVEQVLVDSEPADGKPHDSVATYHAITRALKQKSQK